MWHDGVSREKLIELVEEYYRYVQRYHEELEVGVKHNIGQEYNYDYTFSPVKKKKRYNHISDPIYKYDSQDISLLLEKMRNKNAG